MTQLVDTWVSELVAARASARRFVTADKPTTADEAYQIQAGVARHVGDVGGFKTARKGKAPSIMAPIFASDIVPSDARVSSVDMLGVELEVGFLMTEDCPSDLGNLPLSELCSLLRPLAVIELVDTRVDGPLADCDLVKLTDNQINAGLVVGPPMTDWSGADFGTVTARLQAGTDIVLDGEARVPGGSALETFASLARRIGDHCGGLNPGQIVITGSLHPLVYYPKGTLIQGRIDGIGAVSFTIGT